MEHSRSPSVRTPPWRVAEHLDLDVPGRDEGTLEIERAIAERCLRLGARSAVGSLEILGPRHHPHALATTTGCRLEQDGEAQLDSRDLDLGKACNAFGAGHERHPGGPHLGLRTSLVAGLLHHLGGRADKDEIALGAGAHERGILGEKAKPGVHGLAARRLRCGDDVRNAQIALRRGGWADADGLIGHLHVQRVPLGRRIHGHRLDVELVQGADHADRDLTPIRDENAREHTGGLP